MRLQITPHALPPETKCPFPCHAYLETSQKLGKLDAVDRIVCETRANFYSKFVYVQSVILC